MTLRNMMPSTVKNAGPDSLDFSVDRTFEGGVKINFTAPLTMKNVEFVLNKGIRSFSYPIDYNSLLDDPPGQSTEAVQQIPFTIDAITPPDGVLIDFDFEMSELPKTLHVPFAPQHIYMPVIAK